MTTETLVCGRESPPIDNVTYWCHLDVGHDGFHRDDLGIVLWDDDRPLGAATKETSVTNRLRRRGEVPKVSTTDRRSWLLGLTDEELTLITRGHGVDDDVFSDCLGWGAYHAGVEPEERVRCADCARQRFPLWFIEDGRDVARCWRCSAIRHLTDCEKWGDL